MIGIISADFELLVKKNKAIFEDLSKDLLNLEKSCLSINSNFNNDLVFVNNKFVKIVDQLDYIMKKSNAYYSTLKSINNGYQEQSKQLIMDSKKLIS